MDKTEIQKIMMKQISEKLLSAVRTPRNFDDELAEVIDLEIERIKRRNKS